MKTHRLIPLLLLALVPALPAADSTPSAAAPAKKILFFTRSQGFEHSVIRQANGQPSFAMGVLKEVGAKHNLDFTESKDGSLFTEEYLAKFDALMFYTTGNLTAAGGDRQPPMTAAGRDAFLKAVADGKGFIGLHSATDTFHSPGSVRVANVDDVDPYIKMLGGEFISHGAQQKSRQIVADAKFPGIAALPSDYGPNEEWYSQKNFAADLHVILAQDTAGMTGADYVREPYPATWTRMHGKGRVFYTSMGHREDIWTSPVFQSVLEGGLNWALGRIEADVTPNLAKVAPGANQLPVYVPPPPKAPETPKATSPAKSGP
jgi:type 1 glutamine amidotransferase